MKTRENTNTRTEAENLRFFKSSVGTLDDQRLEDLKKFQDLQLIRNEVLKEEANRFTKKLGSDHPRVQKLQTQLAYNKEMFKGLEKEIEKASIKQEPFESEWWRVHGRVFDAGQKPAQGLTVFLADREKGWIKELGSACTDDKGYYALTLNAEQIKQYGKQPLYLRVSDKKQETLYTDQDPLTPTPGLMTFKDVYLKSDMCVTPPEQSPRGKE